MTEHFHNTPLATYNRLAAIYGEQKAANPDSGRITRWVSVFAGTHKLVFFPAEEA